MARILFVDDHEYVRAVLCDALHVAGHDVTCISTAAEARLELASGRHELLISDVRLHDGDGYELARQAQAANMKVLMITGGPEERDGSTAPSKMLKLHKPFGLPELIAAVERLAGNGN